MGKQSERINLKHHLQKTDEFFTARMKETVTPCPAKSLGEYMEHDQVEEFCSAHSSGLVLAGFGVQIPEGDHAVFTFQDISFSDHAPVEVSAKVYDGLVSVSDGPAVDNPQPGTVIGHPQSLVNQCL